jgi:hypothetical protein
MVCSARSGRKASTPVIGGRSAICWRMYLLISEEHLHELPAPDPALRALLRSFEEQLGRFAHARLELKGFVDGGLGI